jgi:hypothetical protein
MPRQIYNSDYFSGSNVTLALGPCILTQAFGIEYSKEMIARPVYGYHSRRYDAVADGLIQVSGRLILNFVSPRYLTVTIERFLTTMYAWQQATDLGNPAHVTEYLQDNPQAINLFTAMSRQLDIPIESFITEDGDLVETNTEPFAYQVPTDNGFVSISPQRNFQMGTNPQDFSSLLDEFFASDQAVDGLTKLIWGDGASSSATRNKNLTVRNPYLERQYSIKDILAHGTAEQLLTKLVSHIGPNQIGKASDGIRGIDITILYGHPFEDQITPTSFRYDHSSARILKGVRFIGEAETIMSNGEPILDSYSFLARDIFSLP